MATDKVSASVDADLLAQVRAHAGPRGVSAFVATALRHELDRVQLHELLDDLSAVLGPPDEDRVADVTSELQALVGDAQRSGVPRPRDWAPVLAVLDSEALTAVAFPQERGRAARRAQEVLTAVERLGGRAVVPAPVIAEVARSAARRAAVDRVLRRVPVRDTDRAVATRAGALLGEHGLDSAHAVDAFVAATAVDARPAVILTADPDDLRRLVGDTAGVGVHALS